MPVRVEVHHVLNTMSLEGAPRMVMATRDAFKDSVALPCHACGEDSYTHLEHHITYLLFGLKLSLIDVFNCVSVIYLSEQKRLAAKQKEDVWEGR